MQATYLTKPAAVFVQLLGGLCLIVGIIGLFGMPLLAIICLPSGLGLLWIGGVASARKRL